MKVLLGAFVGLLLFTALSASAATVTCSDPGTGMTPVTFVLQYPGINITDGEYSFLVWGEFQGINTIIIATNRE